MQRTFIAIKVIPEKEMSDCLADLQETLGREKIRWVDPANMHITLKFLGDSSPTQVKSAIRILGETVPQYPAPEIEFRGLGLFRNIRDPRVIWIGMDAGPILPELKTRIDEKLIPLGFSPEKRKFRPHLTLGRIKSGRGSNSLRDPGLLKDLLEEYHNMRFQKNRMEELIYYESFLRPEGPEYLALLTVPFRNG